MENILNSIEKIESSLKSICERAISQKVEDIELSEERKEEFLKHIRSVIIIGLDLNFIIVSISFPAFFIKSKNDILVDIFNKLQEINNFISDTTNKLLDNIHLLKVRNQQSLSKDYVSQLDELEQCIENLLDSLKKCVNDSKNDLISLGYHL